MLISKSPHPTGPSDALTDRPAAIDLLMRLTGIAPESAKVRAETVAGICSLLDLIFKLPIPAGEGPGPV